MSSITGIFVEEKVWFLSGADDSRPIEVTIPNLLRKVEDLIIENIRLKKTTIND